MPCFLLCATMDVCLLCLLHVPPFSDSLLCYIPDARQSSRPCWSGRRQCRRSPSRAHIKPQFQLSKSIPHPPQHRHDCMAVALLDALLKNHLHSFAFTWHKVLELSSVAEGSPPLSLLMFLFTHCIALHWCEINSNYGSNACWVLLAIFCHQVPPWKV